MAYEARRLSLDREKVREYNLENRTSAIFFHKLFNESKGCEQAMKEVVEWCGLDGADAPSVLEDVMTLYRQFEGVEYVPDDMPDYN